MAKTKTKLNLNFLLIAIFILAAFLRIWHLDQVPVSLFGDELDVGYQAFSILKTGRDYSGNFMPLHFQSLAEWRTPLYLYSAVPTVALFGISSLGVRLPAVFFGLVSILFFYLLVKTTTQNNKLAALGAFLLAISPWHVQYSRAGFEVTEMLAFFLAGLYFFFEALKDEGKRLWIAASFLATTPWVYSTAKLYLPISLMLLAVIWRKELLKLPRRQVARATLAFLLVIAPIAWSTIFGGGTTRFNYISIFSDPTTIPEVGFDRLLDARVRDPHATFGIQPTLIDRIIHNKFTFWGNVFFKNYSESFSTQFLFVNGDLNPRHSPTGVGQMYRYEALLLMLGLAFLYTAKIDKKVKLLVMGLLLTAPIPAALTRDGGMHATRLFFMLPWLIFLVALGFEQALKILKRVALPFGLTVGAVAVISFLSYQHLFWTHNPWTSERWWHAGFEDAIKTAVANEASYDKVVFSMAGEPVLIFFLGWSEFPPQEFQRNYVKVGDGLDLPRETLPSFGQISRLGKYYFGSPGVDLYTLAQALPDNTLYIATAKEVSVNLIREPDRLPKDLKLVKAIAYPSGEPAFFLLTKNK